MFLKAVLLTVLMIGTALSEINLDEHKGKFDEAVGVLCSKAGVTDESKIKSVKDAGKGFIDCIKEIVDPEVIKNEIEEAKPRGALDEVFKKYCNKSPQLKTCIKSLVDSFNPCIDQTARAHIPAVLNATEQLIDFVCYKDGDRIALFIAEDGPVCFQSKSTELQECAKSLRETLPSIDAAKKLTIAQRCAKYDELTNCVVQSLEGCETPTPANMAESLLRFVRKGSPCPPK